MLDKFGKFQRQFLGRFVGFGSDMMLPEQKDGTRAPNGSRGSNQGRTRTVAEVEQRVESRSSTSSNNDLVVVAVAVAVEALLVEEDDSMADGSSSFSSFWTKT